jgi:hypothetical protein
MRSGRMPSKNLAFVDVVYKQSSMVHRIVDAVTFSLL